MFDANVIHARPAGRGWSMRWVPGLQQWGRVTRGGVMVIDDYYRGLIAFDWLRDRGYEVVIEQ